MRKKKHFITLDETVVDAHEIVAYQRKYDPAANKSEIVIVIKGGAVLKLSPTDELHTPDMIQTISDAIHC